MRLAAPILYHQSHDAKAEVLRLLLPAEQPKRLALASRSMMVAVGRKELGKTHPLEFLEGYDQDRAAYQWLCIQAAILYGQNVMPPVAYSVLSMHSLRVFMQLYQHSLKGKLALAREANPNSRFTFHITTRWIVGDTAPAHFLDKARKTGGELALHKFICMQTAQDALLFLQRWAQVQRVCGRDATCMMECGPSEPLHTRKWIIDLDGKLDDLRTLGFLAPDEECLDSHREAMQAQVVGFGSAISHALNKVCGFLHTPCHFALKSRHKTAAGGYSMLSWHLTLLATAPYAQWRLAMQYMEKHVYPKRHDGPMRMSLLSDGHITRNSKVPFAFSCC